MEPFFLSFLFKANSTALISFSLIIPPSLAKIPHLPHCSSNPDVVKRWEILPL
jgi:hypothetical protein